MNNAKDLLTEYSAAMARIIELYIKQRDKALADLKSCDNACEFCAYNGPDGSVACIDCWECSAWRWRGFEPEAEGVTNAE